MASVWAIGDIHGHRSYLEALLDGLPRGPEDFTVFLGDYIDRGSDSAGVVARVLEEHDRAPDRTVCLWGNHEDLAAEFWNLPRPSTFRYETGIWFQNGGRATFNSFYPDPTEAERRTFPCPPEMQRLFGLLRTYWRAPVDLFPELSHVIWVHAGIPPSQEPEDSVGNDLLWIREDFLNETDSSGRFVVHGHTRVKEVRAQRDKVDIDTGAVYGGYLTALQLPERRLFHYDADHGFRSSYLSTV